MFKVIFYNNKMTNYLIFPDGVIYNTKTHKNIYGATNSSVVRNSIMKNYNCRGFKLKISSLEEYKKFHNI